MFQFVGPSIGHHSSYTFYKAVKYSRGGSTGGSGVYHHDGGVSRSRTKILALGEFFFVKVWPKSDLVAVGEVQLLWEDKNTGQLLSSVRLYFLPEYTPDGRMPQHGEVKHVTFKQSNFQGVLWCKNKQYGGRTPQSSDNCEKVFNMVSRGPVITTFS